MKMILTGERISVERAKELGIVQEIHPVEKLHEAMINLANKMASHSLYTLMVAKQSVRASFEQSGDTARLFERMSFKAIMGLPGKREGIPAFINKRKPDFTGI